MNPNRVKKIPLPAPRVMPRPAAPRPAEGVHSDFSLMRRVPAPATAQGSFRVKHYLEDPGLAEARRELFTVIAELANLGTDPENRRPWLQARKTALLVRILRG